MSELPGGARRTLGPTGFDITSIGFGAWAIGGDRRSGWGPQDDDESIAAIRRALDLGVNWIDTAPLYGLGHSEEVVGRALRGMSDPPYVFTKCSFVWDDAGTVTQSLTAESVAAEVEASLQRLGVEALDLYQIHWPEGVDDQLEEGWQTMADLKSAGKIRAIGVSNLDVAQMKRLEPIAPIATSQPPYSLVDRGVEASVLPYCAATGVGVLSYSPMASGVLAGHWSPARLAQLQDSDWRKGDDQFLRYYTQPNWPNTEALLEGLARVAQRYGCSQGAVAVAWVLANPDLTAAIVGFRRPSQVDGLVDALTVRLDPDEIAMLRELGEAATCE